MDNDEKWMNAALEEARKAFAHGDVPIGAVVVLHDQVIGRGHNRRVVDADPLAHAEIVAIQDAAQTLGNWRLDGASLYVTLEPCPMCAGAMVQARIQELVYAAADPKTGAARSCYQLCDDKRMPHRLAVRYGICHTASREMLASFFAQHRK